MTATPSTRATNSENGSVPRPSGRIIVGRFVIGSPLVGALLARAGLDPCPRRSGRKRLLLDEGNFY